MAYVEERDAQLFRLHYPNSDKPHRCNNCWGVLVHRSGKANDERRFYRWQFCTCWQCGETTLPPIFTRLPFSDTLRRLLPAVKHEEAS